MTSSGSSASSISSSMDFPMPANVVVVGNSIGTVSMCVTGRKFSRSMSSISRIASSARSWKST